MVPVQLVGTLGREVCLFRSMHTMTAAELWSKAERKTEVALTFRRLQSILLNKLPVNEYEPIIVNHNIWYVKSCEKVWRSMKTVALYPTLFSLCLLLSGGVGSSCRGGEADGGVPEWGETSRGENKVRRERRKEGKKRPLPSRFPCSPV